MGGCWKTRVRDQAEASPTSLSLSFRVKRKQKYQSQVRCLPSDRILMHPRVEALRKESRKTVVEHRIRE
jgi:hypothetical protein